MIEFDDLRELEAANIDPDNGIRTYAKIHVNFLSKRFTVECEVIPLNWVYGGHMTHDAIPEFKEHDPADKQMCQVVNKALKSCGRYSQIICSYIDTFLKTKEPENDEVFSNPEFIEYEEK